MAFPFIICKYAILLSSLFFICIDLKAQDRNIDSLRQVLNTLPQDSSRVNTLLEIGRISLNSNPIEAIRFGNDAKLLARKIRFHKGAGYASRLSGQGYAMQSNFAEALAQFQESLQVFDSISFKRGEATILSNIGACHFSMGENAKAIEFYRKSLRISEILNDRLRIAQTMNNIGVVYQQNKSTNVAALSYFSNAIKLFHQVGNFEGAGLGSLNVGDIYMKLRQYDSAIVYYQTSLNVYRDTKEATLPLNHLGEINAEQGDFEQALSYQNEALQLATGLGAKFEMARCFLALAETQNKREKYKLSASNYIEAIKLAEGINARRELQLGYEGLTHAFSKLGKYKEAYNYATLYSTIKDTLYNVDNDKKVEQRKFQQSIQAQFDIRERMQLKQKQTELNQQREKELNYSISAVIVLVLIGGGMSIRFIQVRKTNRIINKEKEKSELLLLNILPKPVADELKSSGQSVARNFDEITVLFTDFKDFTKLAETLSPQELVEEIHSCFKAFDNIVTKFGIEKIKTIGDSYMAAGGLNVPSRLAAANVVKAGIEMQDFMQARKQEPQNQGRPYWEMRAGIHTGPVVAGIVGVKKFQYDIWGDTVNTASRMESSCEVGKVNISQSTYEIVKDDVGFKFKSRGKIEAKNKGVIEMYFVDKNAQ